jgi:hypothetical protein
MTDYPHPIVLVGFEPDWEALYLNGKKVREGHHVSPNDVYDVTYEACKSRVLPQGTKLETTHVETDEMDEHEEFNPIPETLTELQERAPKAYGRISV